MDRSDLMEKRQHLRDASESMRKAGYGDMEKPRREIGYEIRKVDKKLEQLDIGRTSEEDDK